jgi:hypothetical protein
MTYRIEELINRAESRALSTEYLKPAVDLVKDSINAGKISLVQGPPGTGKTTVFEQSIGSLFDTLSTDLVLFYIAPTNKLVADMMQRVVALYANKGKKDDMDAELRLYGSHFDYAGHQKMADKVDNDVKIILSTDYQRPFFTSNKNVCLLIDEASKTPLHQPFITMTGKIIRNIGRSELHCISVIGDPKQAIALDPSYRSEGSNLLILNNFIKGHLDIRGVSSSNQDLTDLARTHLRGSVYEFLGITYRMPSPTERAISQAYYGGSLRAAETVDRRLRGMWNSNIASKLQPIDEKFKKVVQVSEEAITTSRGMIYVKIDREYPYEEEGAFLFEEQRAEAGIYLATCLSSITGMRSTILTTYTDQWQQMKLRFQKDIVHRVKPVAPNIHELVSFGTVQSHLGSEDEIVVCILGKSASKEDTKTIYFQEPELLNVQLTRHRKILCIVGNLNKLRNTARRLNSKLRVQSFTEISKASEIIMEQAGLEIHGQISKKHREGDQCVYTEWS